MAALAGDQAVFDHHFAAMSEHFANTDNPWLIQQCDSMRALGARLGMGSSVAQQTRSADDLDGATAMETALEKSRSTDETLEQAIAKRVRRD